MGRTALLIVDVQHDFLPGGALGVPNGDEVIAPLVAASAEADVVVASRDAHPPDHVSFAAQGGTWPVHCVAGTLGAELDPGIAALPLDRIVDKGAAAARDAYSAFDGTGLAAYLRGEGVDRVLVGGLATDYCVRATALDALGEGFEASVLAPASRAVDVRPGDGERALAELESAGVQIVRS